MVPTSRPIAPSDRIAVSRPEPGPLTKTSIFFMPCSIARRPAASAAICAAKGVDLREPLKPTVPAEAHEITAPVGSVIVTIVLLRSEEHTSELQSRQYLVCRLLLEKKKKS